jgi:hypothetical protein
VLVGVTRLSLYPRHREQWLSRVAKPGVRRGAELFYQQLDGLSVVRHTVRGELLAESRKHQAVKILRQPLTLSHVTFAPRQKGQK